MQIGLHYSCHTKIKELDYVTYFEFLIMTSFLLIHSGDIELNPGPTGSTVVKDNVSTHLADNTQGYILLRIISLCPL